MEKPLDINVELVALIVGTNSCSTRNEVYGAVPALSLSVICPEYNVPELFVSLVAIEIVLPGVPLFVLKLNVPGFPLVIFILETPFPDITKSSDSSSR